MNLPQSPLRRFGSLAAGTVLGLAGVAVVASPAFAHHSEVTGEYCKTASGDLNVTWNLDAVGQHVGEPRPYRLVTWKPSPAGTVTNIAATEDENKFPYTAGTVVTGKQTITGAEPGTVPTVEYKAKFDNGHGDIDVRTAKAVDKGACAPTEQPPAEEEPPPAEGEQPPASQSPSASPSASQSPSASPSASEEPEIPTEDIPVDADIKEIFEVTCDTMTIGLDNPADSLPINLHYKTSKGEERDLTINPGEAKSEKFSASEGFTVDLTISISAEGETFSETVTVPWEKPAGEDCDGGTGGGLPVTGAAAGGIAGGAAALLAVGAVLFMLARRRKVKFTA
ncbi:hypothetical protein AMIS_70730 [Actinoplanes missouriensis 431]|uniref:Gram-positive cocci surface proteins LPxTG domain-containing protein n=1 Tax=Actinoplanes missouriensis (strain ATCC 14538 / DSM 43046 / CBS 188.64 / JCM 3121 / NBRC 102363 / NCIMB 12654 / NRRL B-3342 / UNCC 431) TaxID=512565 RepID=I0HH06_ACTM4|nr:hypothetical protein [Actinoplanes missouriensis]BAL92293.1 hypothetical protein AMIS_70730 [Actinoplanes missouriensis 431]